LAESGGPSGPTPHEQQSWAPEGSLAGLIDRRHLALGLRVRFSVELDVRGGPRRSRGVPGVDFGRKSWENRAKNIQPDCLQVSSLCWSSLRLKPFGLTGSGKGGPGAEHRPQVDHRAGTATALQPPLGEAANRLRSTAARRGLSRWWVSDLVEDR